MRYLTVPATILGASLLISIGASNAVSQTSTSGRVFIVNSSDDTLDANPGDGVCADASEECTLRAAVMEANETANFDVIGFSLANPSVIILTLGEIRITRTLAIVGPGANRLTVQRSTQPGTADFGIFNFSQNGTYSATLRGLTIRNGRSSWGGVYVGYNVTANVSDVVIAGNSGATGGGIATMGKLNLSRALVSSNTTTHQGGGLIVLNFDSTATITNSTLTGNCSGSGGAIYNNGKLLLVNNTISQNYATEQGSSISNSMSSSSTVSVLNTIIGRDAASVPSLAGTFTSLGNNIVTDARGSVGFVNGVNNDQVSDANVLDPGLASLAYNGDDIETMALQAGSPAIDRGNSCVRQSNCGLSGQTLNLASDQRPAYSRSVGPAVDIGAFESGATIFPGNGSAFRWSAGTGTRSSGIMVSFIRAQTGERISSITNPIGYAGFAYLPWRDVYIIERKSKRSGFFDPIVWHHYPTSP